ncbi:hypothetical protein Tco_0986748 [Tanacetum coccineum]
MTKFSIQAAWEALRPHGTKGKLRQWDVGNDTDLNLLRCVLCDSQPDLHERLFFECSFSSQVWASIHHLAGMDRVPACLEDIVLFLQLIAHKRTAVSIIRRLLFAASSYYIWTERNNRLFKKVKRSPDDIGDIIKVTVQLKLLFLSLRIVQR